MKTKILFYFFLLSFSFCLYTCDTNDPPPPPPVEEEIENTITVEEVWQDLDALQIKFSKSGIDSLSLFSYYLYVNGKEEKMYTSISNETVYTDTGLTEGTEYRYSVKAYEGEKLKDTSNVLKTKTLSTTSHEIEWEVDTLGSPGDQLRDVWGLDENNVWAVGYVEMSGTTSGIIKWDGTSWQPYASTQGVKYGIYGFDENNLVYVGESSNTGIIGIWNGSTWTIYHRDYFQSQGFTAYPLNAVWGSSPEDIWAVGREGTIVHWDGEKWEKVDLSLPEDFIFWDIDGTDKNNVYAAGDVRNEYFKLFKYDGIDWKEILTGENSVSIQSQVYTPRNGIVYLMDYTHYKIENGVVEQIYLPAQRGAIYGLSGSGTNNMATVGVLSEVFHYDGSSWIKQVDVYKVDGSRWLRGVYVSEGKIFCVGRDNMGASILIGRIANKRKGK
jgi:hypothetical protein